MKYIALLKINFILFISFVNTASFSQSLSITPYTAGLSSPIDIKNCRDNRLFVAERTGRIRVINSDGTLRPAPFLDITTKIPSTDGERGLLGFAFSPNYKTDRKFYVNYVGSLNGSVASIIEEYKVSAADSNVADISSSLTILTQLQPPADNHKGGNMMFGKDGYLYISLGDGGGANDQFGNGQRLSTFLGKMLRIDISNSSLAQPYVVPVTNPFYGSTDVNIKQEIWAYGLRNAWRNSIDRITGDVWIADVGQNNWEEIDFEQFGQPRLPNYGWNIIEGNACFNPSSGCDKTGLKLPIYEYDHTAGRSITGGYVYRSAQSKSLFGMYLYADFVAQWIDGFRQNNGAAVLPVQRLLTGAQVGKNPISFGEDMFGDMYILFNEDNTVYKISDTSSQRRPKAYFEVVQNTDGFLFQGLEGVNLTYQWLKDGVVIPSATNPDYKPEATGSYRLVVTNTLSFSDTSEAYVLSALATGLKDFSVRTTRDNNIELQWLSGYESDIISYAIERRLNSENSFSTIARIPANNNNGTREDFRYVFVDTSAKNISRIFYRLAMKNKDDSIGYSAIKIINRNNQNKGLLIYPNPAKNFVTISLTDYAEPVQIIMYDYTGKKVKHQQINKQESRVSLAGLKGFYTIVLINAQGKSIAREKLMIE